MEEILEFVIVYRALIAAVFLTMTMVLVVRAWWREVSLFVKSTWYGIPVIGKTARLARQTRRHETGWFQSERTLCGDFYKNYTEVRSQPEVYNRATSYLGKVNEIDRSPLSATGWIVISVLVFVEALGFSYVLAGWTLPGASEAMQVAGAFFISLVASIILVFLTHQTGHELYVRGMVASVRQQWNADRQNGKNIVSQPVTLDSNHLDDGEPHYMQTANRLKGPSGLRVRPPVITLLTLFMVAVVAVGATYVRHQKMEEMLLEETTLNSGGSGVSFPTINRLPDILAKPQADAQKKADDEIAWTKRKGGLATFIVLAVLFVFIQIVGALMGYLTGFAGKEAKRAWRIRHPYSTVDEYVDAHRAQMEEVGNAAQGHLSRLQAKMAERIADVSTERSEADQSARSAERTFTNYVIERQRERAHGYNESAAAAASVAPLAMDKTAKKKAAAAAKRESSAEMEARLRKELAAEAQAKREETEDEMRARLRTELGLPAQTARP